MSFILDALRKSEAERQNQEVPGVADVRYYVAGGNGRSWLPWVAILLAVNVLIVGYAFLGRATPTADVPATTTMTAAPAEPTTETRRVTLPPTRGEVRPLSREIVANEPAQQVSAAPATTAESPPATIRPATDDDPAANTLTEGLPSLRQLALAGAVAVPPLHLDMHVYHPEPARRFVFVNMNKYTEGENLEEGPTVEEIVERGVVLSYQGNRFLLDRE